MARYDEDFKRGVVQDHLSGLGGPRVLASKYGIDQSTIRKWIDSYRQHGDAGLRRKKSGIYYSAQFKLSALKRMWREELRVRRLMPFFGGPMAVTPKRGSLQHIEADEARQQHGKRVWASAPDSKASGSTDSIAAPNNSPAENPTMRGSQ